MQYSMISVFEKASTKQNVKIVVTKSNYPVCHITKNIIKLKITKSIVSN